MSFNFDTPPDRRGTDSQKWQKYAGKDILPMWVADMDFEVAPVITEAIRARLQQPVFGYARPVKSTTDAIVEAMERLYSWKIDPSWLVWMPGLVSGINVACRAFADDGDEILSLSPIYPPFTTSPKLQERVAKTVPLVLNTAQRRWDIDWDALEAAVTPRTKVLIFCHPHNPVGRVWTRAELARIADFCTRRAIILLTDDIHCDLLLEPGAVHEPFGVVAPDASSRTVTFMAPSKAYNVPGLGTSFAIIPDPTLRSRLTKAALGIMAEVTVLGYVACEAAYRDGGPWRRELLAYLRGNRDYLADFVARELPGVKSEAPVQATYLSWLNVADLGLSQPTKHFEDHGVGLSDGVPFGAAPGAYVRINFGCPLSTLKEGLSRMKAAIAAR
ncbi:MAG TPA: PatB family C-S lyase [Opitutaceae bacterium]|jgi:cystathionine beta-lyase|nr:PatB family C-S lyase [Opitutaceae bacterium]